MDKFLNNCMKTAL